ncbi:MAG: hypothetical protein MUD08_11565 [Cytophagales bacterium]|nr:hypothetical protein [Cytophagales bacterium]
MTELCDNTGVYNPKQYTAEQLQNTYKLWFEGVRLESVSMVFKPGDVAKVDVDKLTKEYEEKKKKIAAMSVVDMPYWQNLKKQHLQELDTRYELEKLTAQAYTNPSVLLNTRYSKQGPGFAEALVSGDTAAVLAAWRNLAEKLKPNNGLGDYAWKVNSPDRLEHAKIDLVTFGWYNCANSQLPKAFLYTDGNLGDEFKKLFKKVESECDEP